MLDNPTNHKQHSRLLNLVLPHFSSALQFSQSQVLQILPTFPPALPTCSCQHSRCCSDCPSICSHILGQVVQHWSECLIHHLKGEGSNPAPAIGEWLKQDLKRLVPAFGLARNFRLKSYIFRQSELLISPRPSTRNYLLYLIIKGAETQSYCTSETN